MLYFAIKVGIFVKNEKYISIKINQMDNKFFAFL